MRLRSTLAALLFLIAATAVPAWAAAPLSTLEPAGRDAGVIADLFWWMAVGAAAVWLAAMAFLIHCLRGDRPHVARAKPSTVVGGGGVVLPSVLLSVVLGMSLPEVAPLVDGPAPDEPLRIRVVGEQWWWRVHYVRPGRADVAEANEVRVPRGRRSFLEFTSDNVIHAFWVPTLAGKVDMIPGRTTYLSLEPERAGRFRGICAEFCGTAHARMTFEVVVLEPDAFDAWLETADGAAAPPATAEAIAGAHTFVESGCGGCHTVRGTGADGIVGPDLTHVAGRAGPASPLRVASGELDAWLRDPGHRKPGALMPPFASLGDARLRTLNAYLRDLR